MISRTFEPLVRAARYLASDSTTFATPAPLLLKAGVPIKVVSERLGRATASFTLDVYGWVLSGI